jgi:Nif-specific regulatory protein
VVLSDGEVMPEHLPLPEAGKGLPPPPAHLGAPRDASVSSLAEIERRHILAVLERAKGNRTQAAKWLDIGRNTLARKLKEYGLADE